MKLEIDGTPIQIKKIADAMYVMGIRYRNIPETQGDEGYLLAVICQEWVEREMELKEMKRQEEVKRQKEKEN